MDKQLEFITKELIEEAANNIDINNIPKNHEGKSYAVDINGDLYPFKLLIMEAAKIEGFELESANFGSNEANRKGFEEITGFKCVNKNSLSFHELINELRQYLSNEKSILKDFVLQKTTEKSTWAWVSDHKGLIGIENCHYEIIIRNDEIYVELHFEGLKRDVSKFINAISQLPDNLEFFKWGRHQSIRVKGAVEMKSLNAIKEIKDKLFELDNSIGNQIRSVFIANNIKSKKHIQIMKPSLNQILYGPPGTGKTYNSIKEAVRIANPKFDIHQDWDTLKQEYDRLVEAKQIVFTTFHQSMNYEDFVEGIKPQEPKNDGDPVTYIVEDGIFKQICEEATKTEKVTLDDGETDITPDVFKELYKSYAETLPSFNDKEKSVELKTNRDKTPFNVYKNSNQGISVTAINGKTRMSLSLNELTKVYFDKATPTYASYEDVVIEAILNLSGSTTQEINNKNQNYVLIIDEINRGNVSSIFGELITLIEENKRIDNKEAITVTLPYSKKEFGVPKNLHIIGTMNTADRSVEALDTALRRRFTFTEMPPESGLIKEIGEIDAKLEIDGKEFNLEVILETINKRIEILLDRDHLIGHSFFIKVKNEAGLRTAIGKEIMPLMQEYFYGDYGKISLVLGEGFCKGEKKNENNGVFAKAKDYDADGYLEKMIYQLHDPAAKALGNDHYQMDATTFKNALLLLLNQNTDKNEQEE